MTEQPEALRLAEWLEGDGGGLTTLGDCAAELRRLHAENEAFGIHLSERMKDLAKVEAQRDALLEALKKLDVFFETYRPDGHPVSDPHELARAAITAVEEGK